MTFTPHIRDVTIGEPIDDVKVHQEDQFYLRLNLYDDQGAVWPDNWICNIYAFMSREDRYAGDGKYLHHFSGSSSGGNVIILITESGTSVPGQYQAELVLVSGVVEVTAGVFEFCVIGD